MLAYFLHLNLKLPGSSIGCLTSIFWNPQMMVEIMRNICFPALLLKILSWVHINTNPCCWLVIDGTPFSPHNSGSKSQNCLWNSLIDGLTGNAKEKPRPTIVHDPRPPEEILADELPQLDSPEALVKTSFRFGGLQSICSFLFAAELFQFSWVRR